MLLFENFTALFIEAAPWLVLGLAVAAVMKLFIPNQIMAKHLGKPGFLSTIKAALFGAPLPLCSCGVIPAALALRRSGASKAATTSFLISTPETGIDSVTISYALLGPFMAIIRPLAAVTSAITAGILVGKDEKLIETMHNEEQFEDSCCTNPATPVQENLITRFRKVFQFTFVDLVRDIVIWLLIGLTFAAAIKTYLPNEFLLQWGDGFLAFVVMAVIGVPMYICATASTPIAAGLLFSGVSPGATLIFMLVGPATNIATVGLVKSELGNRALAAYLGSLISVSFAFGYLTNYLVGLWNIDLLAQAHHGHSLIPLPLAYCLSTFLAILILYALLNKVRESAVFANAAAS